MKRVLSVLLLSILVGFLASLPAAAGSGARAKQKLAEKSAPVKIDAEKVTIEMSIGGFDPPSIEIKTGTTVSWLNTEPADYPIVSGYHQVVADDGSFDSGKVAPGASWNHTFLEPGTYSYHCGIHPSMTGEIIVTGPPIKEEPDEVRVDIVEPDPNDQNSWGYSPKTINVEVGTTVIWSNNGAQDHTVTSDDGAFDSGNMKPGDEFKFTFKKAGEYDYHCDPHPWMKAVIKVHEPGKPPPKDETEDSSSSSSSHSSGTSTSSSASSGGGSGPSTWDVSIVEGASTDEWGFDPADLEIGVGDTVVWTNTGEIDHTATADDGTFDSGTLAPGASFEFTFDEVGAYSYKCEPHPFMVGTITVVENPSGGGGASGGGSGSAAAPDIGTQSAATSSDVAAPEEVPQEESMALATETLAGKEVALGSVALTLGIAVAFLLGRWWGEAIVRRTPRTTS